MTSALALLTKTRRFLGSVVMFPTISCSRSLAASSSSSGSGCAALSSRGRSGACDGLGRPPLLDLGSEAWRRRRSRRLDLDLGRTATSLYWRGSVTRSTLSLICITVLLGCSCLLLLSKVFNWLLLPATSLSRTSGSLADRLNFSFTSLSDWGPRWSGSVSISWLLSPFIFVILNVDRLYCISRSESKSMLVSPATRSANWTSPVCFSLHSSRSLSLSLSGA